MNAKNRAKPPATLVASKSVEVLKNSKGLMGVQSIVDRGPVSSHDMRPLMLKEKSGEGFHPPSHEFPAGTRVVMLPVLVADYDDQPDIVHGRGGSVRIDSVLASDPSGVQAKASSVEDLNGSRSERSRYVYGALIMDIARHEVLVQGQEVELTRKEFDLLECLLKHPGYVRSRDVLLNAVWGDDYYGTDRTVDVHIRRLKQKIPLLNRAIVCVRCLGYKLKDLLDAEANDAGVRRSG